MTEATGTEELGRLKFVRSADVYKAGVLAPWRVDQITGLNRNRRPHSISGPAQRISSTHGFHPRVQRSP